MDHVTRLRNIEGQLLKTWSEAHTLRNEMSPEQVALAEVDELVCALDAMYEIAGHIADLAEMAAELD